MFKISSLKLALFKISLILMTRYLLETYIFKYSRTYTIDSLTLKPLNR